MNCLRESLSLVSCAVGLLLTIPGNLARGQAKPTAIQELHLAAFAGLTDAETGLNRNLGITAGVDLGLRSPSRFHPALEVRGTYPVDAGDAGIRQRNLLAGVRIDRTYGYVHPYLDLLAGRNQTNYDHGYIAVSGNQYFVQSVSTVISPGIGLDLSLSDSFAIKLDAQLQRYNSPVSSSGTLYAKPVTIALVYRFREGRGPR